jgi:hypothetical protein
VSCVVQLIGRVTEGYPTALRAVRIPREAVGQAEPDGTTLFRPSGTGSRLPPFSLDFAPVNDGTTFLAPRAFARLG